ncbi:MAG: flagellar hook-basal body complex protein, partial [Desulfurella sp.]|uniref:flagellar hook-basal body complex protein n=1 Tax=Desulfurella sp. TaxID=1962857 RepID=UPI003D0CE602
MMRSLWSGVSGLQANQEFMDVVGNNIANVNTVGFKASLINFSDVLSQTLSGASAPQGNLGGMNPKQIGLGTQIANINKNFSQGSLQTTNITTNLAIQGNGFFIVSGDGGNTYEYTRAGNFNFDANGNLVDPLGNIVQGWMANNTTHTINTASSIKSINIPQNMTVPAGVTKNISIAGNLNGGDTITEMSPAIGTDNMNVLFNSNGNAIGIGQTTQTAQLDTSGSNDLGATSTAPDYNINGQPIALASGATVSMSINGTTNTFTYGTNFTTLSGLASAIQTTFSGVSASVSNGELVIKNTGTDPITISNITTTGDTGGVLAGILQNLQGGPGNSATIPAGGNRTSLPVFSKPGDAVALSYDNGANYNTYIYNYSSSNAGNGNGGDFSTLAGLVANINKDLTNSPWGSNSTASINQDGQIVITNNSGSSQTIGAVYSNNITLGTILGTLSGTTAAGGICASQPFEADIHNTSIDVYDSLGNKHTLTFNFRKVSYDPTT